MRTIYLDRTALTRVTSNMRGLLRGGWGPIDPAAAYHPVTVIYPIDIVRHPTTHHKDDDPEEQP